MFVFTLPGDLETLDTTPLWDAGALGLEQRGEAVRAYFSERVALPLGGEWSEEPEEDWQHGWKQGIAPVPAGRLTITPTWLTHEVSGQKLLMDPGMAFGSGHHDTTRLAVTALGELDLRGKAVLDVGSGSGVLAIAAALLGARAVIGVDNDPQTLAPARDNAALNGVAVDFRHATLPLPGLPRVDVVVANLYAELHDLLMAEYAELLPAGGALLLTGILASKEALVLAALEREGFALRERRSGEDGTWALLWAERQDGVA